MNGGVVLLVAGTHILRLGRLKACLHPVTVSPHCTLPRFWTGSHRHGENRTPWLITTRTFVFSAFTTFFSPFFAAHAFFRRKRPHLEQKFEHCSYFFGTFWRRYLSYSRAASSSEVHVLGVRMGERKGGWKGGARG